MSNSEQNILRSALYGLYFWHALAPYHIAYSVTKECFTNVKQVFLLHHWGSLVTLELISLIPLAGSPEVNPLAVKLLDNRLYICMKLAERSF